MHEMTNSQTPSFIQISNIKYCITSFVEKLELSDNTLTGRIPAQLFPSDTHSGLPALEFLDLEENFLNETLPIEIGNMTFLYSLRLSNNNFSGVIPSTIGNIGMNNMNRQIDIRLNGNKFSGEIPDSLGDIRKLCKFEREEVN